MKRENDIDPKKCMRVLLKVFKVMEPGRFDVLKNKNKECFMLYNNPADN